MEVVIITIRHEIYDSTIEEGFLSRETPYEISSAFPRRLLPPSFFTRLIDRFLLSDRLTSSLPQSLV